MACMGILKEVVVKLFQNCLTIRSSRPPSAAAELKRYAASPVMYDHKLKQGLNLEMI
jgi:hypothetical protein